MEDRSGLKSRVEEFLPEFTSKRRLTVLVIAVLVITLSGFYLLGPGDVQEEPEIEGEVVEVVIEDSQAEPSRPKISPEDGVRFVNNESRALNFTFDRAVDSFVLEPGESRLVDVDSIVYYEADTIEETNYRKVVGGVNVQDG